MDSPPAVEHGEAVADDVETRSVQELLGTVAATVATVPLVLGFVALGGAVLAGRAVADVAGHALRNRNGKSRSPRAGTRPRRRDTSPPSAFGGGELPSQ